MPYSILKHDFMYVGFFWKEQPYFQVKSVVLLQKKPCLNAWEEGDHPQADKLKKQIVQYLNGDLEVLPVGKLDMSELTPFAEKVLCELRKKVKRGQTVSYGKLAELAGSPGASRAVGSVMRHNLFPLFFPCHRVIRSDGSIGLFQGRKAGSKLKQQLLDLERD